MVFISLQIKNSVPAGISDEKYLRSYKDAIMACEKNLLEAELEYAERMHETNEAIAKTSFSELQEKLGTEHADVFAEYRAAANTCAEIHRSNEHSKQQKNWAIALNNVEADNLGLKSRKPKGNQKKRQTPQEPTEGTSGWSSRKDNRTFLRAKRQLPPKSYRAQRPRQQGKQARRQNNGTPDDATMATAIKIALALKDN